MLRFNVSGFSVQDYNRWDYQQMLGIFSEAGRVIYLLFYKIFQIELNRLSSMLAVDVRDTVDEQIIQIMSKICQYDNQPLSSLFQDTLCVLSKILML